MEYPILFLRCLKVVLNNEGGYSDDPEDPGGVTYRGITQREYDTYRTNKDLVFQSVSLMSDDEMNDIYYTNYWLPMDIDGIHNENLILQLFDFGVNAGIRTSIRLLQRIASVPDDGFIGPITLKEVNGYGRSLYDKFVDRRKMFYMALVIKRPNLGKFLKGWLQRIKNTKF